VVGFIAGHADRISGDGLRWGVEPICRVLTEHGVPIAPSTYYDAIKVQRRVSAADLREEQLMLAIARVHHVNYGVYGARKVWLALNREGIGVARCTVERLMKVLGLEGARRGRTVRTTRPDPAAARPVDLVQRQFTPARPDALWVADFERHEALLNRAVVKGHRLRSVAADRVKLRAARPRRREGGW
jgi:putative transposase